MKTLDAIQSFPITIDRIFAALPFFVLAILLIGVPVLLYLFKKWQQRAYGGCEILFSLALGFIASIKITMDTGPDRFIAILGFLSALYVGARGWQNALHEKS